MKKFIPLILAFFLLINFTFSQSFVFSNQAPVTSFATGLNGAYTPAIPHQVTNAIYMPLGYDGSYRTQIVRYDVILDTWGTPIAGPAGMGSTFGFAFNLNDEIYFGGGVGGTNNFTSKTFRFNIGSSTFTPMDDAIASPNGRAYGFSFVINNIGYVGEGFGHNGSAYVYPTSFLSFNPTLPVGSQWNIMAAYPGVGDYLQNSVSFNGLGYAGLGVKNVIGPVEQNDFYEYNPTTNTWRTMTSFPGGARESSMMFTVCNSIILMGGWNRNTNTYYNDIWKFDPTAGATGTWTSLGTNAIVLGAKNGRYGPTYTTYGTDVYFGLGAGTGGRNSDWNKGTCIISMPIKLLSFKGKNIGTSNLLEWTTASEINNDYFNLERSSDGINFESIANVDGAGNSNTVLNYSFVDEYPFETTYYRLKQTDFDGSISYANNIVSLIRKTNDIFEVSNIHLNSLNNKLQYTINTSVNINVNISVVNLIGQQIIDSNKLINKGINNLNLDMNNIINGTYLLKINTNFQNKSILFLKN